MFKHSYQYSIETGFIIDFVISLGKYGVKFEAGDLQIEVDSNDIFRVRSFRIFKVYTSKKLMDEILKDFSKRNINN